LLVCAVFVEVVLSGRPVELSKIVVVLAAVGGMLR
jgi:hypothetical protein